MKNNKNKLYLILFTACFAGYIWLYFNLTNDLTENKSATVCIMKQVTNIPCPSCGTTRSIISLTKGDFIGAFNLNPFGYIVAFIILVTPLWIIADTIKRTNTLFDFYQKVETYFKKPKYAIPLIIIVIVNWIWNISKGL